MKEILRAALQGTSARRHEPIELAQPVGVDELPTPALVVDVAAMERNLERMSSFLADKGKLARPHSKTHKCPVIARRQLELGARGICCAKVSEAEVMVDAGVGPILITSPVVTADKAARVAELATRVAGSKGAVEMVVDSRLGAEVLDRAASTAGISLGVVLDLDVGTRRTGVVPGPSALELARAVVEMPALELRGLQVYAGHLMHLADFQERRQLSREALQQAAALKELLMAEGIEAEVLTGGGTGTFDIDCDVPEMTDLQVGSYLFMDAEYRCIGGSPGSAEPTAASATVPTLAQAFEPALFVLSTAISQPRSGLITIDAGAKAMPFEKTRPEVCDLEGVLYHWAGDEHGILQLEDPSRPIGLGDRLRLIPAHCDPTVNLYDLYFPVVDGMVRELWPISARGCSQ